MVVATRRPLDGLLIKGAHPLNLEPLDEPSGLQLLKLVVGSDRVKAEIAAARSLVRGCGRLPWPSASPARLSPITPAGESRTSHAI
jgi:hypothetical protein